jgi:osmotically-inducible protein OsmY
MSEISTAKKLAAAALLVGVLLAGACSKQPAGYGTDCSKTDDKTLVANVTTALSKRLSSKVMKDIKVDSKDRVVTLSGIVNFSGTKQLAGDLAKKVDCVKDVVNNIQVTKMQVSCGSGHECCCPETGCECLSGPCPPCQAPTSTP